MEPHQGLRRFRHCSAIYLKENYQKSYSQRSHSHEELSLGRIYRGNYRVTMEGVEYLLKAGDLVLIPPEVVHLCNPQEGDPLEFIMLYISMEFLNKRGISESAKLRPLAIPCPQEWDRILQPLLLAEEPSQEYFQGLGDSLLSLMEQWDLFKPLNEAEEDLLAETHQWLLDHPQDQSSLKELAAQAAMSPYHFIRRYSSRYGLTPHAQQMNRRIQRALLLLRQDIPAVEVAQKCGFYDQSHFNRHFKLYTGFSPGDYLKLG